jgi:hypothetical protein
MMHLIVKSRRSSPIGSESTAEDIGLIAETLKETAPSGKPQAA